MINETFRRPLIDFHVHPSIGLYKDLITKIDTLDASEKFSYTNYFPPGTPDWSADIALEMMEREQILAQVLSLPDATVMFRGDFARRMAREFNEAMAEIVSKNSDRFAAFAVLPYDDIDSTLAEMAYALDVLKLDGICTTSNVRGIYLGDPIFDPWMEELHRRAATLFIHPAIALSQGVSGPQYLELSFDSTRMIANLITSGAKRRFSNISMIATHAGGAMPFLAHRFQLVEVLRSRGRLSKDAIDADLTSFYYDLTGCMSDSTLNSILDFADTSKLLMGFDYPYAPRQLIGPELARFFAFDGLSVAEKDHICIRNALNLLPRLGSFVKEEMKFE